MKYFDITAYGAIPCDLLQTEKIQKAIDECFLAGGGEVVVPAGFFRTGGLRLRSNVTLRLKTGAVLEGSRNCEDYNAYLQDTLEPLTIPYDRDPRKTRSAQWYSRWSNGLLKAVNAENIAVIGEPGSFIDGAGCMDPQGERDYRGPHPISFWNCKNVHLEGYTIKDSGNWAHAIFNSENIDVHNVSVYGGLDGINFRSCQHILVEDCLFYTGDNCVAGFDNYDWTIRRCVCNSGVSTMLLGGTKVLVEDCKMFGFPSYYPQRNALTDEEKKYNLPGEGGGIHTTGWGIQYYCDFRANPKYTPGDFIVRNCEFSHLRGIFNHPFGLENRWCINRSLSSIRFENCKAEGMRRPVFLTCDPYEPMVFEMENVTITPEKGLESMPIIVARNVKSISLKNVTVEGFTEPCILTVNNAENVTQEGGTPLPVEHVAGYGLDVFYLENWMEVQKDLGPDYRQYC